MRCIAVLLLLRSCSSERPKSSEVLQAFAPSDWSAAAQLLKTGDLVLFNSKSGATATIIRVGTWGDWTHVGLVVVMVYDSKSYSWSVVAEQGGSTVLCVMEVANHATVDIVTADQYHGFQVSRLLDKVQEGYSAVLIMPLENTLEEADVLKLQNIVACLHAVRTRYEKGKKMAHLMLMTAGMNSGEDLTSMFCSDFVAYVAFEMGWLSPDLFSGFSSKNLSPQDFLRNVEASAWNQERAILLDMESARREKENHKDTEAEKATYFTDLQAPDYWLKRTLQYENEVLRCSPTKLEFLYNVHREAYNDFEETFLSEIHAQTLWSGVVGYSTTGDPKVSTKQYVRLVAQVVRVVAAEGIIQKKLVAIYYGSPEDGWLPNDGLTRQALASNHIEMGLAQNFTATFRFQIVEEDQGWGDTGERLITVPPIGPGDKIYIFVSFLLKQALIWASDDLSVTYMLSEYRPIWIFPKYELDDIEMDTIRAWADLVQKSKSEGQGKDPLESEEFLFLDLLARRHDFRDVYHLLFRDEPKPLFTQCQTSEGYALC